MSRRARLLVETVVAALLWLAVIHDGSHRSGRTDQHLVPELGSDPVAAVTIRHGDQIRLALRRAEGGDLELPAGAGRADPVAVRDLLDRLRFTSCIRRERAASERSPDQPEQVVTVELLSGATIELAPDGPPLPDLGWQWIRRADRDDRCLVDRFAAQALTRDNDDLRQRQLFDLGAGTTGGGRDVTGIELHAAGRDLVLGGRPLAVHLDGGGAVRVDPAAVGQLLERLGQLRIGRFAVAPTAPAGEPRLVVRVIGVGETQELIEWGDCPAGLAEAPGDRLVDSPVGAGCVGGAPLDEIAGFAGRGEALYDRRLVGAGAAELVVTVGDRPGLVLRAQGGGYQLAIGDAPPRPAESGAVTEWIDQLDRLLVDARVAAPATGPVRVTLERVSGSGARDRIELRRAGGRCFLRRAGESVDWLVSCPAAAVLRPSPLRFRRRQLIAAEPFALRHAVRRRGDRVVEEIERGELLEDWRVVAPERRRVVPDAVGALRQAAAELRARRFVAAEAAPRDQLTPPRIEVEVEFDPRPGAEPSQLVRHRIELGRVTSDGCLVRVDGDPAVAEIDQSSCRALAGPWSTGAR